MQVASGFRMEEHNDEELVKHTIKHNFFSQRPYSKISAKVLKRAKLFIAAKQRFITVQGEYTFFNNIVRLLNQKYGLFHGKGNRRTILFKYLRGYAGQWT